jgi:single-strand DNA-binding protein
MARGLNKVQIIGNLGADPEMRYTPSGTAVTNFRVAVNRNRRGQDGNNIEETEWFRVVAWEKLAETCNEYLRKGQQVYVEGRLQSRKYMDKDNIERTSVEIVANEMMMLGGRGEGGEAGMGDRSMARVGGQPANGPQRQQPRREEVEDDKDIDELPF